MRRSKKELHFVDLDELPRGWSDDMEDYYDQFARGETTPVLDLLALSTFVLRGDDTPPDEGDDLIDLKSRARNLEEIQLNRDGIIAEENRKNRRKRGVAWLIVGLCAAVLLWYIIYPFDAFTRADLVRMISAASIFILVASRTADLPNRRAIEREFDEMLARESAALEQDAQSYWLAELAKAFKVHYNLNQVED